MLQIFADEVLDPTDRLKVSGQVVEDLKTWTKLEWMDPPFEYTLIDIPSSLNRIFDFKIRQHAFNRIPVQYNSFNIKAVGAWHVSAIPINALISCFSHMRSTKLSGFGIILIALPIFVFV